MKICIISNYKKNGYGESTRPYYLSVNLVKQGHEILHLCQYEGIEDGIAYVKIQTSHWEPSAIKRTLKFSKLGIKVRAFNPDIIYMHQFNNARWALATKIFPRKKFVFDAHTSAYFEARVLAPENTKAIVRAKEVEGEICRKSDYIICASGETKDLLAADYKLNEKNLFVVDNATNMTPVSTAELATVRTSEKFTCVTTLPFDGFLSNELALQYLFEIAAEVETLAPGIKFVVFGGGEKPAPPTGNVEYAGYVNDLRAEILKADIAIMPYPEKAVCGGARNKFCDFVALGKVVVSSPEGMRGMHTLEPGKNCVVATGKIDYAQKIVELYKNKEKLKVLEINVLKVSNLFNWADRAHEVAGIFEKILQR